MNVMYNLHMKNTLRLWVIIILSVVSPYSLFAQQSPKWQKLDEGLFLCEFDAPVKSDVSGSKILVMRIDPRLYEFKLLCRSEMGHEKLTISEWSRRYGLIGAINAGMFQTDHSSNVGYMKNYKHINNKSFNKTYQSVAVFDPVDAAAAPFKIIDTDVTAFTSIVASYNVVIQNLRLIKHPGINRWQENGRKWSEAALGEDAEGNVLFIYSRSPYSMHEFNQILLQLPINLVAAQHLEGGPEASMFLSYNDKKILRVGSFETGFQEDDLNTVGWPLPNVLGFSRRK